MTFSTPYFNTGAGSVLHSGIYNREFSSMLASMATSGLAYLVLAAGGQSGPLSFAAMVVAALITFPLFRRYVFRERYLRTVFDKNAGMVSIHRDGILSGMTAAMPLKDIRNILVETKQQAIGNDDGVEFVKKISLQHNTAIPGFGEENPLYVLTLKLADGTDRVIFAGTCMQEAIEAHDRIKSFIDT